MNDPADSEEIPAHRRHGGIFITRGARVAIPVRGLSINFTDGSIDGAITVHVGLDTCPIWAAIAIHHLKSARSSREQVMKMWRGTDETQLGDALIQEFTAGMQSIAAAAIAIDALYAQIKEYVKPPDDQAQRWSRNRTARFKQVAEVFRFTFNIPPRKAVELRKAIQTIYRFRDWAVHPPAGAQEAAYHPDLHFGTEWRFVAFSYPNALQAARASLSICWQVANKRDLSSSALRGYCEGLGKLLAPVVTDWESTFGSLSATDPPPSGQTA